MIPFIVSPWVGIKGLIPKETAILQDAKGNRDENVSVGFRCVTHFWAFLQSISIFGGYFEKRSGVRKNFEFDSLFSTIGYTVLILNIT